MKNPFLTFCILATTQLVYGQATSQTDTLQSGELMLKQEIIINASVDDVWKAFTEPEQWKKWATPVVQIDFRINGTIQSNYDPKAKIGDKGTITLHIPFYIPKQQIVMQAEIADNFPEFAKGEEKNLYTVNEFQKISDQQTKVIIYGIGYKNEPRWHELLNFFIRGNEMMLNNLKKSLEQ